MCGIVGAIAAEGEFASHKERWHPVMERMLQCIRHRGPDGEGIQLLNHAILGHRRLSVIDLEARSNQPMSDADGRTWVTYNGEVYNFVELRSELERAGFVFRTTSDTEVLVHGYRHWGIHLLERLRGMFAFGIWDEEKQQLLLARDRFGQKPLFYAELPGCLLFASEVKSMLEWPDFEVRPNDEMIFHYLTYNYCLGPDSAFAGVRRLPPAHTLTLRLGERPVLQRYWQPPASDPNAAVDVPSLCEELIERFDDAVRVRMVADVPIGAFLSGGVDSSAVVARMAQFAPGRLKTFSVGFGDDGNDETHFARQVADRYGTDHYAFTMNHAICSDLPQIIWHYNEPFADSSSVVTYALSREVRRHVTVAVNGDGGDEMFLGYPRYFRFAQLMKGIELGFDPSIAAELTDPFGSALSASDWYASRVHRFSNRQKQELIGERLLEHLHRNSLSRLDPYLAHGVAAHNAIDRASRADIATYLPDDLLVKVDIANMAHSLEGRSPFLDHCFCEWVLRLPQNCRVWDGEQKALLKKAFEPYLPHETMYRPKLGFAAPVERWLREELRELAQDTLLSQRCRERGYVRREVVESMMRQHVNRERDLGRSLWTLLCLELWFRTFIDSDRQVFLARTESTSGIECR